MNSSLKYTIYTVHVSISIYIIKIWYRIEWSRKASPYIWRVGKIGSGCSRTIYWINKWAQKSFCCPRESPIFCLKSWNHRKATETHRIEDRNKVLRSQTSRSSCRHGRRILCLLLASCCCCWGMGYSGYSFGDGKKKSPKLWIYRY